jgi:hypothetical protein
MKLARRRHLLSLATLVLAAAGCVSQRPPATTVPPSGATAHLVSAKSGKTYSVIHLDEVDAAAEPFAPPTNALAAASPDNFHGTDRGNAKTSLVDDPQPANFADLESFLASPLLVPDGAMLAHDPPITKNVDDPRTAEEQHNVEVTAFLYASRKESDNDFHCIIGAAPDHAPAFFNVEISGLPLGGEFRQPLKDVRDGFKTFFSDSLPGPRYVKFDPPIPVHIKGALFFDVDHPAGAVGPTGLRPATAWEIHPVSTIELEPASH